MSEIINLSRRLFVKTNIGIGAGLVLGVYVSKTSLSAVAKKIPFLFSPSAWVSISDNGDITIMISRSEMGQGISTAFAMIVADEMDANWDHVIVKQASVSNIFGSMSTGGSKSVRDLWGPLREAGAMIRQMLLTAASQYLQVPVSELETRNSCVYHVISKKIIKYSDLIESASRLSIPKNIQLKQKNDYRLIGNPVKRVDAELKTTGKAQYGIDVNIPGMLIATVVHAPVFGSIINNIDSKLALNSPGVKHIYKIKPDVVAIVADTFSNAKKAVGLLKIDWKLPELIIDDAWIKNKYKELSGGDGDIYYRNGDLSLSKDNYRLLDYSYECGFQAHLTMEPMNCTAHVHKDGCDVWCPTQNPQYARSVILQHGLSSFNKYKYKIYTRLGLKIDFANVHVTTIGCGFGRRLEVDFIEQAVLISKHCMCPIKLIWSREEDVQHDYYRPYTYHKISAGLYDGKIIWKHHVVGAEFGKSVGGIVPDNYNFHSIDIRSSIYDLKLPIGSWRSVGSSHNTFVIESMVDELANSLSIDPYEFRLKNINNIRAVTVLKDVAKTANWRQYNKKKSAQGIALYSGYDSFIAMIAEVKVEDNSVRVEKIYCSVDCGLVINPQIIKSQIEGGIAFALTATLLSEINIENGRVKQSNFHDVPFLSINEMPTIDVNLITNSTYNKPGGIGELAVPVVAPAVMNAVYSACGVRIRKIPLINGRLEVR